MNTLNATKHTDLHVSQEWPYTLSQGNPAIAWMYPPLKHIQDQSGLGSVHSNPAVVFSVPCREVGPDGLLRPFELKEFYKSMILWSWLDTSPTLAAQAQRASPHTLCCCSKGKAEDQTTEGFFFFGCLVLSHKVEQLLMLSENKVVLNTLMSHQTWSTVTLS